MNSAQTDNSHFEVKVELRTDNLPKTDCRVLDCYSSDGRIWDTIRKREGERKIQVLRIEQKRGKKGVYLAGDNRKFLQSISLDDFDVIDLDAYGVPYEQLKILFAYRHSRIKTVFVTYIQSMYGALPTKFLSEIGYPKAMIIKCPSLFYRDGFAKLKQYLAQKGITQIKHYQDERGRKHYLCFTLEGKR